MSLIVAAVSGFNTSCEEEDFTGLRLPFLSNNALTNRGATYLPSLATTLTPEINCSGVAANPYP